MKNKVQLITYADRLGDGTIKSMTDILRTRFDGVYDGVHILPFFTPFDGADAGFDPIDHTKVDERLGSWDDVAELSKTHNIMVDAIVNHMSWESKQFQDVLAKGEESEYYPMFLTMCFLYSYGAHREDLAGIYRPRPGLPFTHYKFAGKTRLVWVSFTPQQVDIDTDSDKGWEYLMSIFDQMAASHVSYIRLDAVGYGAKEAGTSCFMTPKTFKLISRLREEGVKRGLEILIEVHSYYKKQVEIASKVDRVYDFALPPLLLHSLFTGHVEPVAHWTDIRPNNAVTVLDTHDGIGVIDIGSDQLDRSLKGLVPDEDVDNLVNTIHANTHGESQAATGAAASNLDLYQVNSTYYSALGCNDQHYIAARAVQFFLPGVPQVYYGSEWGIPGAKADGDPALRPAAEAPRWEPLTDRIAAMIALRRAAPVLRHGDYHNLVEGNEFLLFERAFDGARAVVGVNLTDGEKVFSHGALGCRARVFDLTADRGDARKTGDSADETDAGTRGRAMIDAAPVVSLGGTLTVPPHGVVLALVEP